MRTILLATIAVLSAASVTIQARPAAAPSASASVDAGYSLAHVAQPGTRSTVIEI